MLICVVVEFKINALTKDTCSRACSRPVVVAPIAESGKYVVLRNTVDRDVYEVH